MRVFLSLNTTSFLPWGKAGGGGRNFHFNTRTIKVSKQLNYLHSKVKHHHFSLKPVTSTDVPVTRGFEINQNLPDMFR